MPPTVVFRTDASIDIGSGHVMRCLALAEALAAVGWTSRFICRALKGHLGEKIQRRGYPIDLLECPDSPSAPSRLTHGNWLPVSQTTDAEQTVQILEKIQPLWLIVDHYALDIEWEDAVRPFSQRMMALDDLADRRHGVNILLDQNLGRESTQYENLLDAKTTQLLGPDFALINPRYRALRKSSLARRASGRLERLLIAMGGVDKDNVTGTVLSVLAENLPADCTHIDVVLGSSAPHSDAVRHQLETMPVSCDLHVDTPHMADLMAQADLAIGAAGGTSWERCCLGLPVLLSILAGNQNDPARALEATGAALSLGTPANDTWRDRLVLALGHAAEPPRLLGMSRAASEICDGKGIGRTTRQILSRSLDLRAATAEDAEEVWVWRHHEDAHLFYKTPTRTPLADHRAWFAAAVRTPDKAMFIAASAGTDIGFVRFDLDDRASATISICMAPQAKGKKLALACIETALLRAVDLDIHTVYAEVHRDNAASVRLFERAGFFAVRNEASFAIYERQVHGKPGASAAAPQLD